jgi:hypothetical protein
MLRGSSKEKDGGRTVPLNNAASNASKTPESHGDNAGYSNVESATAPDNDITAKLQEALAVAREETAALRQELERVKQDAQASVEISKYQATEAHQHTSSESAMAHVEVGDGACKRDQEAQHQRYEREEDLISQNHDLRYRLAELQDQLIAHSIPQPPDLPHSEADWNALTLRLHETEKESHSRLQQLLSLKSSISSLTRTDSQISDSELAESFSQLANRVREWVVSNYRRTKMNFDGLPYTTVTILKSIKAKYETIERADKLALYQAVVSLMLMRIFDEPITMGLRKKGMFEGMREFAVGIQNSGAEFREWRRATVRAIERSELRQELLKEKAIEMQNLANELEGVLFSITSIELTTSSRLGLTGILNMVADLQRTLCLQKAEYRVLFFDSLEGKDHYLDNRTMEPVNDLEYIMDEGSDMYTQRKFAFCVFPCLEKLGGETGDRTDMSSVVLRARVCCGVG